MSSFYRNETFEWYMATKNREFGRHGFADRFGVTSHQAPTRWCVGIHDVDLRCAFSQCLLKRPPGVSSLFLRKFWNDLTVVSVRIWSIINDMIWYDHILSILCLYYTLDHLLYQPLTPQFHIDIPWKSANKNSTLTHQSERWCPPQPTIDFESNKTASCYQMLFNKHMSHEQWTKTWLCRVYRKLYCPVLWGIMIKITIRIQWSLSKTPSTMESIRVSCRWKTLENNITWSELSLRER